MLKVMGLLTRAPFKAKLSNGTVLLIYVLSDYVDMKHCDTLGKKDRPECIRFLLGSTQCWKLELLNGNALKNWNFRSLNSFYVSL